VVSNHGGRQCDYARSGCEALIEIIAALKKAGLRDKCQVFVDGGIRRGTDVFKLMCLGADGVGLGRAILHGLAAYGEDGVARVLELLQLELESCFRQVGCTSVSQVSENYVVLPSAKL
jgi:L-lactate dehydrogenase (cytochrome)